METRQLCKSNEKVTFSFFYIPKNEDFGLLRISAFQKRLLTRQQASHFVTLCSVVEIVIPFFCQQAAVKGVVLFIHPHAFLQLLRWELHLVLAHDISILRSDGKNKHVFSIRQIIGGFSGAFHSRAHDESAVIISVRNSMKMWAKCGRCGGVRFPLFVFC